MADDADDTPMSAHSSPSSDDSALYNNEPTTPARTVLAELSPPNSRGPSNSALPTLSNISNISARRVDLDTSNSKNANGKRVLQASDDNAVATATGGNVAFEGQTGAATATGGLREPQPPGWAWQNKKAREEAARALDGIVQKELMVGARYGDPLLDS